MDFEPQMTVVEWELRLGAALRATRIAGSLTQVDLAEQANVSLSAVKNLENGKGSTLRTLVSVARALALTTWLASLSPPATGFSPMALLSKQSLPPRRRARTAAH